MGQIELICRDPLGIVPVSETLHRGFPAITVRFTRAGAIATGSCSRPPVPTPAGGLLPQHQTERHQLLIAGEPQHLDERGRGQAHVSAGHGRDDLMRIQFWFEFASTYSYPAAMRIEHETAQRGVAIEWKPFLLGHGSDVWSPRSKLGRAKCCSENTTRSRPEKQLSGSNEFAKCLGAHVHLAKTG